MNVLLLGGSGFIGAAVCKQLLELCHAVRKFSCWESKSEH